MENKIKNFFNKNLGKNGGKQISIIKVPFELPKQDTIEYSIVMEALSQVGKLYEIGVNDSPNLREYLKLSSFVPGYPWCQYFQNSVGIRVMGNLWPHGPDGSTQRVFNKAVILNLTSMVPEVGSMITWQSIKNPAHGHVGLVVGIKNENTVYTVEGNSKNQCRLLERNSKKGFYGKKLRGYIKFQ